VLLFILTFFVFNTFLHGGRIEALQAILLYGYLRYRFLVDVSKFRLAVALGVIFVLLTVIGLARSDPYGFLAGLTSPQDFVKLFIGAGRRDYVLSTEGDAFYASARMLGLIDVGLLSPATRVMSFVSYLFNIFAPSDFWPDYANLASYRTDTYSSGGGGLIAAYFFVWLGYAGPAIAGILIGLAIRGLYTSNSVPRQLYALLILVTFPRWYNYSPIVLVKFCVVGILLYRVCLFFGKMPLFRSTNGRPC
jgi:multisubunit Na+/H+ antiporter MnhG subunit